MSRLAKNLLITLACVAVLTIFVWLSVQTSESYNYAMSFAHPPRDCRISYALVRERVIPQIQKEFPGGDISFSSIHDPTKKFGQSFVISNTGIFLNRQRGEDYEPYADTMLFVYEFNDGRKVFQSVPLPDRNKERPSGFASQTVEFIIPPLESEGVD